MPLVPEADSFLAQLAAAGAPPTHTLTPEAARRAVFPAPLPLPEIALAEDRTISGPTGDIPVRLYMPDNADSPGPGLVFFHGGGWVLCNVPVYEGMCRALAIAGNCRVVSVEYRLAPEHQFPAGVEDCLAATQWILKHGRDWGIDPARVAVGGDSAGGNLAAAVCLMCRDRRLAMPAYQLLIYPITNNAFDTPSYCENATGYLLTRDTMQWFWQHYVADPQAGNHPYASPLQAKTLAGLPPAYVLTAEYDPLRDEGEAYARRLAEAGVPTELERVLGLIHGYIRRTDIFPQAMQAIETMGNRLRQHL